MLITLHGLKIHMHPLISIFPLDSINMLFSASLCDQDIMSFIFFTFAVVPELMIICLLWLFPNVDNQHTKMSAMKRSSSFLLNLMMRPLISFACRFFGVRSFLLYTRSVEILLLLFFVAAISLEELLI